MNTDLFEKVSYGGRVLRNASAMTAEREALRMGIEYLTVLFPTEVSSFDFQVESTDRTVQYKLNSQSLLRFFGLHRDVNDAHRAGAKSPSPKQNKKNRVLIILHLPQARLLHQPQLCQATVRLEHWKTWVGYIPIQHLCQVHMLNGKNGATG